MEKITADFILETMKTMVESKKIIQKEDWLNVAFKLNLLSLDEKKLLNQMSQELAKSKLDIYKTQEKKNKAAADLEIEATDKYRFYRDQEDKIYSIEEFIRIAKKNADLNF